MLGRLTIFALLAAIHVSAFAQSEPKDSLAAVGKVKPSLDTMTGDEIHRMEMMQSHKLLFSAGEDEAYDDSIARTIELFYLDQFRSFSDPELPYFLFMSKDTKLAMGIGGSVRMRGWADFDGAVPTNGFIPYMIPTPNDPDQSRAIGGTPGGTALFFKIVGRDVLKGNFMAYIQADFSGANNVGFKLKKAYVIWNDWTIGYAASTFSDPAAEAPTIDGAGQNGTTSHTTMLVRWMHTMKKHWQIAASVELPSSQIDADGVNTKALKDYIPDVSAFAQYQWGHGEHVRLAGIVRTLPYENLITRDRRSLVGWGIQTSALVYPVTRLGLFAEINYGKGYSAYMGDLSVGSYDLVPDGSTPGKMYAPESFAANIGLRYNFSTKFYSCLALGQVRYYPSYRPDPTDYKYGQYLAVNLFYQPTPRLLAGIEYLRGARHDFSGTTGTANRIDVLFQFAF